MLSRLIRYLKGYLRIRVCGYSTERFLNACRHRGIFLWGLQAVPGAYEMNITIGGFRQLKPVIRKTGARVTIRSRNGLPFCLHKYRKRKLFFAGAFLFAVMIIMMSQFVWSIDIRGNMTRTDETLLKFLSSKEVHNGMAKSEIDCPKIVKDIRKKYDDIIWVSASVKGTKLIIQVKENEDSAEVSQNKNADENKEEELRNPYDIIADRNCTIESMIVRKGIQKTRIGKKVKKGQILVSGQIPVNNDAGEVIDYQYQVSDADIIGKTVVPYKDSYRNTYIEKKKEKIYKEEYFVKIGKIRFTLGGIKNHYEHFEMKGSQGQLKLFDNFYLPFFFGVRTAVPYTPQKKSYTQAEIQQILTERFLRYCEDLEKKGVEIIENDVKIYTGSKDSTARGSITVRMPVGKKSPSTLLKIPKQENEQQTGEHTDGNDGSSH